MRGQRKVDGLTVIFLREWKFLICEQSRTWEEGLDDLPHDGNKAGNF